MDASSNRVCAHCGAENRARYFCWSCRTLLDAIPNRVPITREDEQRALDKGMAEEHRLNPALKNLHATRNRVTAVVTAELRGPRWAVAIAEWFNVRAEPVKRDLDV